jgi:hypothetical protein
MKPDFEQELTESVGLAKLRTQLPLDRTSPGFGTHGRKSSVQLKRRNLARDPKLSPLHGPRHFDDTLPAQISKGRRPFSALKSHVSPARALNSTFPCPLRPDFVPAEATTGTEL